MQNLGQPPQAQELSAGLQDVQDLEVYHTLFDAFRRACCSARGNTELQGGFRHRGHCVSSCLHFEANTEAGARLLLTAST